MMVASTRVPSRMSKPGFSRWALIVSKNRGAEIPFFEQMPELQQGAGSGNRVGGEIDSQKGPYRIASSARQFHY